MKVSVVKGDNRKKNIKKSLELMDGDIKNSIKKKILRKLFIKVNGIDVNIPKASTNPIALEAVIEYFKKYFDKIIIGDNSFGFQDSKENMYTYLKEKYGVQFSDLTEFGSKSIEFKTINGTKNGKISLLPKKAFTISLALPKTHDYFVFTGCSKNMMGCVLHKRTSVHGLKPQSRLFLKKVVKSNKIARENLIRVKSDLKPDLAVMDAFTGMEGNGPVNGNTIKIGLAFCSLDANSLDYLVSKLFGFEYVPYLSKPEPIKIVKAGFNDLNDVSVNFKKHYSYRYQLMTESSGLINPIDFKFGFSLLKRPYRLVTRGLEILKEEIKN